MASDSNTEEKVEQLENPTVARTYQLTNIHIPPPGYDDFLVGTTDVLKGFVLNYHDSASLREIVDKVSDQMIEVNRAEGKEVSKEEALRLIGHPFLLSMHAQLKYSEHGNRHQRNGMIYDHRYVNSFFDPVDGKKIDSHEYKIDIQSAVAEFEEKLTASYPARGTYMPSGLSRSQSHPILRDDGFDFRLHMTSMPTQLMEVDITLKNNGSRSASANEWYTIPGIEVKVKQIFAESFDNLQNVLDRIDPLITDHYAVRSVKDMQSTEHKYKK